MAERGKKCGVSCGSWHANGKDEESGVEYGTHKEVLSKRKSSHNISRTAKLERCPQNCESDFSIWQVLPE